MVLGKAGGAWILMPTHGMSSGRSLLSGLTCKMEGDGGKPRLRVLMLSCNSSTQGVMGCENLLTYSAFPPAVWG